MRKRHREEKKKKEKKKTAASQRTKARSKLAETLLHNTRIYYTHTRREKDTHVMHGEKL